MSADAGKRWRVQSGDRGEFDEIAVGDWLHIEALGGRVIHLCVGDLRWNVHVSPRGAVTMVGLDNKSPTLSTKAWSRGVAAGEGAK